MAAAPGLAAYGWDAGWASALAALAAESPEPSLEPARVSRVDRGACTVIGQGGERRAATARSWPVAVGDWVALAPALEGQERARIVAVLPRRHTFRRLADAKGAVEQVLAANIDTVLVCDALDGTLGLRHLERFLALAWQSGATPVVLVTKSDAAAPEVVDEAVAAVRTVAAETPVLVMSAATGAGLDHLATYLAPGRTLVLLGLSGAGKSTLVNLLAGAERLATTAVRSDGKGRHTTTHRELILLPSGALLIDTPGMRALSVIGAEEGIGQAFEDLETLAQACEFVDCSHEGMDGCAISAALADGRITQSRLSSWARLKTEVAGPAYVRARVDVAERKRRKAAKVAERRASR